MTPRALLPLAIAALTACASGIPRPEASGSLDPRREYLLVAGAGKADGPISSDTQRKSLSRDAALADAWRRAAAQLESLPALEGGTVRERIQASPELRDKLAVFVRSADVVTTRWRPDGTALVLIRLPSDAIERVLGGRL